jgi:F-type H+-transporting ATPase subunit delta
MANMVLPSKYAQALYNAAFESNNLNAVTEELRSIKKIIDTTPKFKQVLYHPGIDKHEKTELVTNVFGEKVTKLSLRLMLLLIEKKRESIFNDICDIFFGKVDELSGLKRITIETAFPLEQQEKAKLIAKLEKAMDKKLTVDTKVNPEILGGIIIRERVKQIDASVIQFLRSMKTNLNSVKADGKVRAPGIKKAAKKPAAKKAFKKTAAVKKPKKAAKKKKQEL